MLFKIKTQRGSSSTRLSLGIGAQVLVCRRQSELGEELGSGEDAATSTARKRLTYAKKGEGGMSRSGSGG
jgi:hypothetical protein